MDSYFKGDFGQYFTPPPLIQFAVEVLEPSTSDLVLDPARGSGGFLLYALDYIRHEADQLYPKHETDADEAREHFRH